MSVGLPQASGGEPASGPQVLVVDNDPALCQLLEMAFARGGASVYATGDVAAAEARLEGGTVDALLMDLNLGAGHSGPEVLAGWRERHGLPPCWMVTGTPDDARLPTAEALPELRRVVAKPFSVLDLVREVVAEASRSGAEQEMSS